MKHYDVSFHIIIAGTSLNTPAETEYEARALIKKHLTEKPHTWLLFNPVIDVHDAEEVTDG